MSVENYEICLSLVGFCFAENTNSLHSYVFVHLIYIYIQT